MKYKFYLNSFNSSFKSSIFISLFFIIINQIYFIDTFNFSNFNQSINQNLNNYHQNNEQINQQNQLIKRINSSNDQLIANLHIYQHNLNRILDKKSSNLNIDRKENKLIQRFRQDHLDNKKLDNRKYVKLNYRREDRLEDDENRDNNEDDELNNEKSNRDYNSKVNKDEESTNELNNESSNDENNNESNSDTNQDEENKNERSPDYQDEEYKNKQKFDNEQPRSNKDDYDSKENENSVSPDDETKYEIKEEIEEEKTKDDDDDLKDDDKFKDDIKYDEKFKNEFTKQINNNKKNDNKNQINIRKPASFESTSGDDDNGIRFPSINKYSRQFTPRPRLNSFDKTIKLKENSIGNRVSNSFYNKIKDNSREDNTNGDNSKEVNYSSFDLNRINLNQDTNNKFEKHEELLIELLKKRFLNNQKRLLELKKEEKRKQFLNEIDESFTIRKLNREAHKYAEIEKKLNRLINLIQNQQKQKELNSRFINYPITIRDLFNNHNLIDNNLFDQQNLDQKLRTTKKTKFRSLNSDSFIYPQHNKFYHHTMKSFNPINPIQNNQLNWLNEYLINKNNYQLPNYHPLNYPQPNFSIKRYPIFKKIKSNEDTTTTRATKTNQFNEKLKNSLPFNLFGSKQTGSNLFQTILQPTLDSNFRKLSSHSPIKYQYHLLQNLNPSIPLRLFTNDRSLVRTNKVTRLPQFGGIMLRGSGYSNH